MDLHIIKVDGTQETRTLGEAPITIGRGANADLVIKDGKISRLHCGIQRLYGEFYVKDLKSKNGTFVNNERVDLAKLSPGDRIRVGSTILVFEGSVIGPETAIRDLGQEMAQGKGYSTLLQEIVEDLSDEPATPPAPSTGKKAARAPGTKRAAGGQPKSGSPAPDSPAGK